MGGCTPFPGFFHFTLDKYLIIQNVKEGGIEYHFLKVFGMTRPGIEPWFPGPLANTLFSGSMSWVSKTRVLEN